jgi:F0F1-type ATP synthase assembly protein I
MLSKKIIISILLMILGLPLIFFGWHVYVTIDIDQGGTIAMIGNIIFLTGAGVYAYKYKLRRPSTLENKEAITTKSSEKQME